MQFKNFKKAIASLLVSTFLVPHFVHIDFSFGDNRLKENDLIVLLVEKNLFESGAENNQDTLTHKIYRYAEDIRKKHSHTKVKIIRTDSTEKPSKITSVLEKYYLEGEKNEAGNEVNRLVGVVLVGDIPFPVIRFKQYFIPTVFPYTDFENPAFVWNNQTSQFEENSLGLLPRAEIWHGIIKAPGAGDEVEELSAYFDKNHAFYQEEVASEFDQQVFYADIIQENKSVNADLLNNYLLRLDYQEDLAYLRYNKHFAKRISNQFFKNSRSLQESNADLTEAISSVGAISDGIPDIQSIRLIEKFLPRYAEATKSYVSNLNTYVANSGRWTTSQTDSFPSLVTKLDALILDSNAPPADSVGALPEVKMSLKNLNTFFEDALNQQVEVWQKNVTVVSDVAVEIESRGDSGTTETIIYDNFVNGKSLKDITAVEECTLYRGTPQVEGVSLAQQVESNRLYDPTTSGDPSSACNPYGQCCGNNYSDPDACQPSNAYSPVYSQAASIQANGVTDASACYSQNYMRAGKGVRHNAEIISGYNTNSFSSVFKHNEPRNETIQAAVENQQFNPDLPADDPRYVSFQNQGYGITNIPYFNFFKLENNESANSLEQIAALVDREIREYALLVDEQTSEQNFASYKAYLRRYLIMQHYSPESDLAPPDDFESKFSAWQQEVSALFADSTSLSDYFRNGDSHHNLSIETLFASYFPGPSSNLLSFPDYIANGGDTLEINTEVNGTVEGNGAVVDYTPAEMELGIKKQLKNSFTNLESILITYQEEFQSVNYLPADFWQIKLEEYGLAEIYATVQWNNAFLDQKRRLIFENYINQVDALYPTSAQAGYESLYLRAEGGLDYIDLSVPNASLVELQEHETVDAEWDNFNAENEIDSEEFDEIAESALEDECGDFTEGVPIWEWLGAIQCWLSNLGGSSVSNKCTSGECLSGEDGSAQADAEYDQMGNPSDVLASSQPDFSQGYNTPQKIHLRTDPTEGPSELFVDISTDADGHALGNLLGRNPVQLVDGKGSVMVQALTSEHEFLVTFKDADGSTVASVRFNPADKTPPSSSVKSDSTAANPEDATSTETLENNFSLSTDLQVDVTDIPSHVPTNSEVELTLTLTDLSGNPQTTTHSVEVSLTSQSQKIATLTGSTTLDFSASPQATLTLQTFETSGTVYLLVKTGNTQVRQTGLEINVGSLLTKSEIDALSPQVLYVSLLGESFADLEENDTVANRFLFSSGKTQAVTALQGTQRLYPVGVNLFPDGRIEQFSRAYDFQVDSVSPLQVSVHNTTQNSLEVSYQIDFEDSSPNLGTITGPLDSEESGIYFFGLTDGQISTHTSAEGLSVQKNGSDILQVDSAGAIQLLDDNLSLSVDADVASHVQLNLLWGNEEIGIIILLKTKITIMTQSDNAQTFSADGSTNGLQNGVSLVDQTQDPVNLHLELGQNLTSSQKSDGIGWTGDYKNQLLFASQSSVGNSIKNYASVFEVLLGDPVIRLKKKASPTSNNFNQAVGKQILTEPVREISRTFAFNFNNDEYIDVGVIFSDGYLKLLLGTPQNDFKNYGDLLFLEEEIASVQTYDFAEDGYEDLFVLTSNGKTILFNNQNQTFTREEYHFNLPSQIASFQLTQITPDSNPDFVFALTKGTLGILPGNPDGTFSEIPFYVYQLAGTISSQNLADELLVYFEGVDTLNPEDLVELEIQETVSGSALTSGTENVDSQYSTDFSEYAASNATIELVTESSTTQNVSRNFLPGDQIPSVAIEKQGQALGEAQLDLGSTVEYSLKIRATSAKSDVQITDFIPSNFTFQDDTLSWENCGANVLSQAKVHTHNYPFLLSGLSFTPGQTCEITYQVTVNQTPQIHFWLEDVAIDSYSQDGKLDFGITVEGNTSGQVKYLIAQGDYPYEYVEVHSEVEPAQVPDDINNADADGNGIPDRMEQDSDGDGTPDFISDFMDSEVADSDGDGLPDSFDKSDNTEDSDTLTDLTGSLENVAEFLEGGCQGGCLNIPVNYSFFTPGPIIGSNLAGAAERLGIEMGEVTEPPMVLPIFAWGHHLTQMATKCEIRVSAACIPTPQPIWALQPAFAAMVSYCTCNSMDLNLNWLQSWKKSLGRIYLSPTLTGSLGMAVCMGGEYPDGKCFATALDSIVGNLCDAVGISESDGMSQSSGITLGNGQALFSVGAGAGSSRSGGSGGYNIEFNLDNFEFSKTTNINQHAREIGNILTRWFNRQIEEVANALLDLPTIYLYYPTFDRVFEADTYTATQSDDIAKSSISDDWGIGESLSESELGQSADQGLNGLKNAYDMLKSLPFITLKRKDVQIKIPYIDKKTIESLQTDWKNWKDDAKKEIERAWDGVSSLPDCNLDSDNLSAECEHYFLSVKVIGDAEKLLDSIDKNLEILETYAQLPREILKYKKGLLGYLEQLTCVLNQVMELTGGWIVKNMLRYQQWKQFILTLKTILEGWESLLDVMVNYKNSCETCKAETYQYDMWSMVSGLIPEPPIIKFPRWPDIKIDLSQINANLELELPRLHFVPEPIVFPRLPKLKLPDGMELTADLSLPAIPLLPELPALPQLPEIPSFDLPQLPDLPPPPAIPEVPSFVTSLMDIADILLQIYCLIKQGFWIYDEDTIKSTIENLTSRPSGFVAAFDFLHLNMPEFSIAGYDILVESQVNLELEADYVTQAVESMAEPWNELLSDLVQQGEDLVKEQADAVRELLDQEDGIPDEVKDIIKDSLDDLEERASEGLNDAEDALRTGDLPAKSPGALSTAFTQMQTSVKQSKLKFNAAFIEDLKNPNLPRLKQFNRIIEQYGTELEHDILALENHADLSVLTAFEPSSSFRLASAESETVIAPYTEKITHYTSLTREEIQNIQTPSSSRLLANNTADSSLNTTTESNASNSSTADSSSAATTDSELQYNYRGAYLYDEATDQTTALIKYDAEADSIDGLLFLDYDRDGDDDILYHMGNDLYLKDNQKNKPPRDNYPYETQVSDFASVQVSWQAVKNYRLVQLGNGSVTVNWDVYPATDVSGYLIVNASSVDSHSSTSRDYFFFSNNPDSLLPDSSPSGFVSADTVSGPLSLNLNSGYQLDLLEGETLSLYFNEDQSHRFELENGFYYSVIHALREDGTLSTRSQQILLPPQIEADTLAPIAILPDTTEVYLNQIVTLPFSHFILDDSSDFNVTLGQTVEGVNIVEDGLQFGAFSEPQTLTLDLNIVDLSGNQNQTQTNLEVKSPALTLNDTDLLLHQIITGTVNPVIGDIPVSIYRERFGKTKLINTSSAQNGKYLTDTEGRYSVSDLDLDPSVIIRDNTGTEIARMLAPSGQFELNDSSYQLGVLPQKGTFPLRVSLLNSSNKVVASSVFSPDSNYPVQQFMQAFTANNTQSLRGVYFYDSDTADSYDYSALPGDAPLFPDGAAIIDQATQENLLFINVDGSVHIPDNVNLYFRLKQNSNTNTPLIFELLGNNQVVLGEVFIATGQTDDVLTILPEERWNNSSTNTVDTESSVTTSSPGISIYPGDPTECYFLDYAADVHEGDFIFSAVSDSSHRDVWSKSNRVAY